MPRVTYTRNMILAMCDAPWYWEASLREAAKQYKIKCTSVTPIATVVALLRVEVK